jgi:biotin transport system substrate-specific component
MLKRPQALTARVALASLFSALLMAGAFIAVPIPGGPPVVIQNLFAVLAGLLLGPVDGGLSVLLFLAIGAIGFPVFSGGRGGLAHLAGPTGGYLIGYMAAALVAGIIARNRGRLLSALASSAGFLVILALGVIRLKFIRNMDWTKALLAGVLPFLLFDGMKAAICAFVAIKLGPFSDSIRGIGATRRG